MNALLNFKVNVDELSVKTYDVPGSRFEMAPELSREIGRLDETHAFSRLTVEIRNTPERPFPADVKLTVTGIFDVSGKSEADQEVEQFLNIQAIQMLFPYVRSILTSVTANAMMPPIVLPIVDVRKLFDAE